MPQLQKLSLAKCTKKARFKFFNNLTEKKKFKMATTDRFTLDSLLQAVQEYRVTHLPIVPPIAAVLAKGSTKERLSNNGGGGD
jgi:hypothetical protein